MKVLNSITSATLSKKTDSILCVFNKTISGLVEIINSAKEQAKAKEEEIVAAQEEKASLEKLAEDNQAIVDKLKSMLS